MKTMVAMIMVVGLSGCAGLNGTSVTYKGHTFTYTSAKGVENVAPIEVQSGGWVQMLVDYFVK